VWNTCQTADPGNTVCSTGTFTTDDLWIRFGHWNAWDLKVGRFEGWEIYHLGLGMDPYTLERLGPGMFGVDNPASPKLDVPALYGVNYMQGRPTEGFAVGDVALHFYPTDFLRFEVLTKVGTDNYQKNNATGATASTYYGERDTAILDFGWVKFKAGLEYQKRSAVMQDIGASPGETMHKKDAVEQTVRKGGGASLQFVIDPIVEFGLNAAIGRQDDTNSMAVAIKENSFTTKSVGGFANVRITDLLLLGGGINWTTQTDDYLATPSSTNNFVSDLQGFGALQYLLAGQLFIKGEVGYARVYFQPSDGTVTTWYNTMVNTRVRLMYLY
jgi:hypothetical protein